MDIKIVWNNRKYYQLARAGSLNNQHYGMSVLSNLVKNAKSILDLGCGEGTRLNSLIEKGQQALGVDISELGIKLAKKSFPGLNFKIDNLESLSLKSDSFDLIYSAYVLEHLDYPEKVIREGIRLTKPGGRLVLIAPNYGAPNRASPPFRGSRKRKIIFGIIGDFGRFFFKSNRLGWNNVDPIIDTKKYDIDWDVTIEPYIGSLVSFLKHEGLVVEDANSCWEEELEGPRLQQRIFKILGSLNIYPFMMWGPHLVVVARKSSIV